MTKTVLVTGISGFIAKHVALTLLKKGYQVKGSVRSLASEPALRQLFKKNGADETKLTLIEADLNSSHGWEQAVADCDAVQHIASPFPIQQPQDREALVEQAKQGTLTILAAAKTANVKKVVITSSIVAMGYRAHRPKRYQLTEQTWTDPEWKPLSAYVVSKTRAELAVWQWAKENNWKEKISVVNPGFVLGPALDAKINTSLEVIKMLLEGTYPALPPVHFPIIDVRDLAAIQVAAQEKENCAGRRLLAAGKTASMLDMAKILRQALPQFQATLPKSELPLFLVKLVALFDRTIKTIRPDLGIVMEADADYVTKLTGVTFRSTQEAIIDAAKSLIRFGLIKDIRNLNS